MGPLQGPFRGPHAPLGSLHGRVLGPYALVDPILPPAGKVLLWILGKLCPVANGLGRGVHRMEEGGCPRVPTPGSPLYIIYVYIYI